MRLVSWESRTSHKLWLLDMPITNIYLFIDFLYTSQGHTTNVNRIKMIELLTKK